MSQNNIYLDQNSNSYYHNNPNSINNSYLNTINNKNEMVINNSYTRPNLSNYNNNNYNTNNNSNIQNQNIPFDNGYIKDRYTKIKEENAILKKKLFEIEKDYKIQKGDMEEKILVLRDENSNLQIQLQKAIEKQKDAYKNSDTIYNDNKVLLNNINLLQNDVNSLKDNITRKNAEIEEKNKIITDLLNEKNILLKEEKMLKNQIENITNDKDILIKQIQDLNNTIGEKIAPKLKQNENTLVNLQDQIENLRIDNEKYKSDNTLLFNENKIQKNLIKILTKQNKKLLGEIKIIYDRDILLMDNMEKMGSNNSENFKKFFDKNSVKNQNLFEEEISILKQSQKYINDEEEENIQNIQKNNKLNTLEINEDDNSDDIINKDKKNKDKNKFNTSNNQNNKKISESSSFINNEIIIKRNKESIDIENDINKNINKNINNNIQQKNLYNSNSTDDINNNKISFQNVNISPKERINIGNTNNNSTNNLVGTKKENILKNDNIKSQQLEKKLKIDPYNTDINKLKYQDMDDDIKINNKLLYSEEINENEKNKFENNYFNNDYNNKNINDNYLYSTDGIINIKPNINIKFGNIKKNYENNDNEKINQINSERINKNNEVNLYNQSSINIDEKNNALFHSQAKSLLSEYVEDLDVIQYKEDNNI